MSNDTSKLLNACAEYRAMVDKLEAENTTLKQYIANKICPTCDWKALLEAQEKENAALREDKERLDWVIKDSYYHFFFKLSSDLEKGRRQIDAARKEAQP